MANSTHARLDSIQLLRAIAALVVVWDHAVLELRHFHVLEQSTFTLVSSMGRAGVDIFFVIRAVTKFLSHIGLGDTLHAVLFLMAVLLLCITVAMLSYRLIERPSNRFLRNWSRV